MMWHFFAPKLSASCCRRVASRPPLVRIAPFFCRLMSLLHGAPVVGKKAVKCGFHVSDCAFVPCTRKIGAMALNSISAQSIDVHQFSLGALASSMFNCRMLSAGVGCEPAAAWAGDFPQSIGTSDSFRVPMLLLPGGLPESWPVEEGRTNSG